MLQLIMKQNYPNIKYVYPNDLSLSDNVKNKIQAEAKYIYLDAVLIDHSDKVRFGKIHEDLHNLYLQCTNNYPIDIKNHFNTWMSLKQVKFR